MRSLEETEVHSSMTGITGMTSMYSMCILTVHTPSGWQMGPEKLMFSKAEVSLHTTSEGLSSPGPAETA